MQFRTSPHLLLLAALLMIAPATGLAASKNRSKGKKSKTEQAETPKKDKYTKMFVEDKRCLSARSPFLTLHKLNGKLYAEVPLTTLGRELLIASTISEASDISLATIGYKPKDPMHVMFTRRDTTLYLSEAVVPPLCNPHDTARLKAIRRSTLPPVVEAFKFICYNRDSSAIVVDMTKFFAGDTKPIAPIGGSSGLTSVTAKFRSEASGIDAVKAFEDNVSVKSSLSYTVTASLLGLVTLKKDEPTTLKVTRTILLLPEQPMRPRVADARVGLFLTGLTRFNGVKERIENFSVVNRWNLQPSDPEAWRRGACVEPVKPIVFYLDDAFPALWREPIRRGVLRWNRAFEKLGFRNAVRVEDFPADDPSFDPDNLKYSCIRYVPAPVANAMGPSWVDPRSGEIINASVLIYNDVVDLIRRWRFVQTAQVDERARGLELPDDLFSESLEYVAAHEVGHCLGLMHNMAASSAYPVDSLRSAAFTQRFGTTPSIMDYARFNYVAQPSDRGVRLTPPDLGPYDLYAIEYGYRPLPEAKDLFDEEPTLRSWVDARAGDPIYRYGRQQVQARYDPTALEEDLGDDPLKAGDYGIANLKYILDRMDAWIPDSEDPDFRQRTVLYEAVTDQFKRYVNAATLNIGGIRLTEVNADTPGGPRAEAVDREVQRASLEWVLRQMMHSEWLDRPELTSHMPLHVDYSATLRYTFCRSFFDSYKRVILAAHIARDPYTPQEYMDDLYRIVWESALKGRPATAAERLVQRTFIEEATDIAIPSGGSGSGSLAEIGAPSVDEILLRGLDDTGLVARYLEPLREAEEQHGRGYVARMMWGDESLTSGYGWQRRVNIRAIDESWALYYGACERVLKLLRSRLSGATGETRDHYRMLIHTLERGLYSSQR